MPEDLPDEDLLRWEDVRDSFDLAMQAEGIDRATINRVILTVDDAIANNAY